MVRWVKWFAVATMFVVGFGAVYVSTAGLGDTQAATSPLLTQAALRTDVLRTSAATGTVAPAGTYALAFGEDARLASDTATTAGDSEWTVADIGVSIGDRVSEGQVLATAATTDADRTLAATTASLGLARLKQAEAEKALKDARTLAQRQLVDAKTAVTSAELALKNAKVQRDNAAAGNPKRQAKIGVIQAQDQRRAAKRTRDDLKKQLRGDFPEQRIAVGEAEGAVADLETQVDDLTAQVERASIVAPVDGVVSALAIKPGFVAPASNAIEVETAALEVIADVVESDVSALEPGQTAIVSIDALDLDMPGAVMSVAPSTDGATSSVVTFPVTVALEDPDPMIKPGMSSEVEITIAQAPGVVAVPAVALAGSQGSYQVRVVAADGSVESRGVTIGLVTETLAEVQSGLAEGEEVVVGTNTARVDAGDDDAAGGGRGGFGGGFGGLGGGGGIRGGRGGGGN